MKRLKAFTKLAFRYLRYYFKAQTCYDIQSPFITQLAKEVIEDDRCYYIFEKAEIVRSALLRDDRKIKITDYGAGSTINPALERTVKDVARHSAIPAKNGRFLFRLVKFHQPENMLELGTSLGISSMYQKAGALNSRMCTIEGCPCTATIASEMFAAIDLPNLHQLVGPFREMLPKALSKLSPLSYLYVDGDHRKDASIEYFNTCLPHANQDSLFVIADIYWSEEMEVAWKKMKAHPQISLSIDFFHFGLLFFRKETGAKKHYTIIPSRYKPWKKSK
ncbi:MAG: class I SAM-dependent methyltransferase [Chitinophagales bacterium]|nr:class I SAM-dependent methyltransferase [Chitinophagales bacterium]